MFHYSLVFETLNLWMCEICAYLLDVDILSSAQLMKPQNPLDSGFL